MWLRVPCGATRRPHETSHPAGVALGVLGVATEPEMSADRDERLVAYAIACAERVERKLVKMIEASGEPHTPHKPNPDRLALEDVADGIVDILCALREARL